VIEAYDKMFGLPPPFLVCSLLASLAPPMKAFQLFSAIKHLFASPSVTIKAAIRDLDVVP
jgi:hypothetical protein